MSSFCTLCSNKAHSHIYTHTEEREKRIGTIIIIKKRPSKKPTSNPFLYHFVFLPHIPTKTHHMHRHTNTYIFSYSKEQNEKKNGNTTSITIIRVNAMFGERKPDPVDR